MIEAVYGLPRGGKSVRMVVQQSLTGKIVMCERSQSGPATTATYDSHGTFAASERDCQAAKAACHGRVVAVCKACLQETRTISAYAQTPRDYRREMFLVNPHFQVRRRI
jgi:O-methyltransferase involved in polyketide biosynthesis